MLNWAAALGSHDFVHETKTYFRIHILEKPVAHQRVVVALRAVLNLTL